MSGKMNAKDRLILALDPNREEIKKWMRTEPTNKVKEKIREKVVSILDELEGEVGFVKVNYVSSMVPDIIDIIQQRKIGVWLDGKYKDIPGTVEGWTMGAILNNVDKITIHADGGLKMIQYATEIAKITKEIKQFRDIEIFAISVLTSIGPEVLSNELKIPGNLMNKVMVYAKLAEKGGVDGVVASAMESPVLARKLKSGMHIITPAITPNWAIKRDDQNKSRITTPYQAIISGSTKIVVGSAIIDAETYGKTRIEAAQAIVAEIDQALTSRNF
ncbi:MAG: orotidine 5'-phosphate decarboxylase [Candidatus Nealsonbacteria bacterium]|nr:orotidine 5'-phosphate decarboxylase [Candidatus Nealsonbacteria bacterium]